MTDPIVLPHKVRNFIRTLHHTSERNAAGLFLAEGVRVCRDLLGSDVRLDCVVVAENASDAALDLARELTRADGKLYEATPTDMAMMADASTPQDILAVVAFKTERPLGNRVVVLDAVSDPGNVGTIIRSAAWFGFTDVVLGKGGADAYNPKVVRSAAGALFRMNVLRNADIATLVQDTFASHTIIASIPHGGDAPSCIRGREQLCLLIGSEAHGISASVLEATTLRVTIPGGNGTESLNAAVAASILCYEASVPADQT